MKSRSTNSRAIALGCVAVILAGGLYLRSCANRLRLLGTSPGTGDYLLTGEVELPPNRVVDPNSAGGRLRAEDANGREIALEVRAKADAITSFAVVAGAPSIEHPVRLIFEERSREVASTELPEFETVRYSGRITGSAGFSAWATRNGVRVAFPCPKHPKAKIELWPLQTQWRTFMNPAPVQVRRQARGTCESEIAMPYARDAQYIAFAIGHTITAPVDDLLEMTFVKSDGVRQEWYLPRRALTRHGRPIAVGLWRQGFPQRMLHLSGITPRPDAKMEKGPWAWILPSFDSKMSEPKGERPAKNPVFLPGQVPPMRINLRFTTPTTTSTERYQVTVRP
jgi:hypothetical protein